MPLKSICCHMQEDVGINYYLVIKGVKNLVRILISMTGRQLASLLELVELELWLREEDLANNEYTLVEYAKELSGRYEYKELQSLLQGSLNHIQ